MLEAHLRKAGTRVVRGGDYDRWDLEVSDGTLGSVRLTAVVEEHGAGRQLIRFRLKPHSSPWTILLCLLPAVLSFFAAADTATIAAAILAAAATTLSLRMLGDTGTAMSTILRSLSEVRDMVDEQNNSTYSQPDLDDGVRAASVASAGRADS
jgi:hypothetical protein